MSRELSTSLQEMTSNYQAKIQETDAAQTMIKKLTDELNEIKSQGRYWHRFNGQVADVGSRCDCVSF